MSTKAKDSMSLNVWKEKEEEICWTSAWMTIAIEVDLFSAIEDIFSDSIWENEQNKRDETHRLAWFKQSHFFAM